MNLFVGIEETEFINSIQFPINKMSHNRFKGSSSKKTTVPRTSAAQQGTEKLTAEAINKILQNGLEGFDGQLTADIPQSVIDAFDKFTTSDRSLTDEEKASLGGLATGESFYDSDPDKVIQDWRENFANPLTSYYNEFVRPEVREEFNVPGGFSTSERAEGVTRAFDEFYGKTVAPTLFQAQENERQREFAAKSQAASLQLPALQYKQNLPAIELAQEFGAGKDFQSFYQPEITARYNEFLRKALGEFNYTQLGASFSTTPTSDTIIEQGGGSGLGGLGAAGGMALGALLAAPTGGLSMFAGGALGAGIGGGVGTFLDN